MVRSRISPATPPDVAGLPDGELLGRYLADRDSAALEALVRRHGGMVLGVCRRVLGDPHDADDAFQATFLVFVRKADAVRPRDLVGPWLYGVATRTALKARALAAKRRAREKQVDVLPDVAAPAGPAAADWLPLLDGEVERLPAKYRLPVVLCELQGHSRAEAARRLRVPEGTRSSRLARARALLRRRLARRGAGAAAVLGAVALFPRDAAASVPAALAETTVRAATAFAAGTAAGPTTPAVLLAMAVLAGLRRARLARVAAVLVGLCVLSGVAGFMYPRVGRPAAADNRPDWDKLQGVWALVALTMGGVSDSPEVQQLKQGNKEVVFEGDTTFILMPVNFRLDPTKTPKQIDLIPKQQNPGFVFPGIYELNGDELKVCFNTPGAERPTRFVSEKDSLVMLLVLKRKVAPP